MEFKNYYKILGVTYNANLEQIEKAYKREYDESQYDISHKYELIEAYSVLKDAEKRRLFDIELLNRIGQESFILGMKTSFFEDVKLNDYYLSLFSKENNNQLDYIDNLQESTLLNEDIDQEKKTEIQEQVAEEVPFENIEEPVIDKELVHDIGEAVSVAPENEIPFETEVQDKFISDPVYIPITRISEPVENEQTKEEKSVKTVSQTTKNLGRALIIAGSIATGVIVIGPIGGTLLGGTIGIAVGDFYKKHAGKIKLQIQQKEIELDEFQTLETKIINEQTEKLKDSIYDLLSKPEQNYKLEITKLQYKNSMDLLKQRMELYETKKVQKGLHLLTRIKLLSFKMQYKKCEKILDEFEKHFDESIKKSKLSTLNKNLILDKKEEKLNSRNKTSDLIYKNEILNLKISYRKEERDRIANKMVLHREGIARNQKILLIYKVVKSKTNEILNNIRNSDQKQIITEQEEVNVNRKF